MNKQIAKIANIVKSGVFEKALRQFLQGVTDSGIKISCRLTQKNKFSKVAMKFSKNGILAFLFIVFCAAGFAEENLPSIRSPQDCDTVILKQGQRLSGEILAERESQIYLDVGFTVLSIPKENILKCEYAGEISAEDVNDANKVSQLGDLSLVSRAYERLPGELYYTVEQEKTTIEACVEAVAEAVVKVSSPAGMGSGFFLNQEGYLITNYHVIEKETKIEVTVFRKVKDGFEKKKFKKVKIEAINPFVDLALLKVEDLGELEVRFVPLGDVEQIKVGEEVFAVGNPLGLERTVTNGVISTKNRAFEGLVYIQTNADINPGNSGGPLFNLAGEVIGVTNMGYIFFGGLGFAIPADYVRHFVENREAFAYDKDNPNSGFRYIQPDKRRNKAKPSL
ncbi:MAG: trypsin-like peptidase domain-containing protein [Sedimentisphaerales bacterium]|nr:trypsin-like peptidase domain-containing protein [Sedimentisphaerales bacterium]